MRVLVGCEFSGRVATAFRARGHEAWSCDLEPTELLMNEPWHIRDDLLAHLNDGWDLLIAFPPCTHLSASGARYWPRKLEEQRAAIEFVRRIDEAPIEKIAFENPIGILSTALRPPDQIVHPWWFGDPVRKSTCLWLKNLPRLIKQNMIRQVQRPFRSVLDEPPSKIRQRERSRTFYGIAEAFAQQWG